LIARFLDAELDLVAICIAISALERGQCGAAVVAFFVASVVRARKLGVTLIEADLAEKVGLFVLILGVRHDC
jgi:hypothetical protein